MATMLHLRRSHPIRLCLFWSEAQHSGALLGQLSSMIVADLFQVAL